jgi:hypothetical protein
MRIRRIARGRGPLRERIRAHLEKVIGEEKTLYFRIL